MIARNFIAPASTPVAAEDAYPAVIRKYPPGLAYIADCDDEQLIELASAVLAGAPGEDVAAAHELARRLDRDAGTVWPDFNVYDMTGRPWKYLATIEAADLDEAEQRARQLFPRVARHHLNVARVNRS